MALIYEQQTQAVIGALIEVHRELGAGFLESVYDEALGFEFDSRKIPYSRQPQLRVRYKQHVLESRFTPDFICFDAIIVEIKAVIALSDAHSAQLMNYLKTTGMRVGLLVNFGSHPKLKFRRFAI